MTSVLSALSKLPRYVKILSTNGLDRNEAVVLDAKQEDLKERLKIYKRNYYRRNRASLLEKKKAYNRRPEVKKRIKEWHHNNYQIHKDLLKARNKIYNEKNRERIRERRKRYRSANKERLRLKQQEYYKHKNKRKNGKDKDIQMSQVQ